MADLDDGATPAKVKKLSSSVTEISSEADSSMIDMETQKALEDIDACQNEIDSLNEKASEEILCIEQKYNKLRKPHFEKRNELITQIPNFWVTTFINHPQISHLVSQAEEKCLQYLTRMEISEFEDIKSGYSLSFYFNKNPYFSNDIISKSYFFSIREGSPHSKSTTIRWKNKDLSRIFQSKKVQNWIPGVGPRVGSFFSWFAASGNPLTDKIADLLICAGIVKRAVLRQLLLRNLSIRSYQNVPTYLTGYKPQSIGATLSALLKDDIWPNPLQFYLAPDIEVEENGRTDDDTDNEDDDDSVVIVGDDDSDDNDDDVYEVDDFDDTGELGDESVELLEVDDDDEEEDDDDDVEVIGSDSDLETSSTADTSQRMETSGLADTSQTTDTSGVADTSQDGNDKPVDKSASVKTSKSDGTSNEKNVNVNDKEEVSEDGDVTTTSGKDKDADNTAESSKTSEIHETQDGIANTNETNSVDNKDGDDNKDLSENVEDGGSDSVSEVVKDGNRGDKSDLKSGGGDG